MKIITTPLLIGAVLLINSNPVKAETTRKEWFEGLMRPDTHTSCCDISDCKATLAKYNGRNWEAVVNGKMMGIPNDKILKDTKSIDGEAYVCASQTDIIYCFIQPNMGF